MEENEEPNLVIPRPFPHEPLETLERSLSLDVTPEREPVKRSRVQRKKNRRKLNRAILGLVEKESPGFLCYLQYA